ncbi:helix-turn-helix domain-containing protein [Pseudoclavibacter albus]|uniref:helix-turn-helix domain-containing protein n=1 Tax=Pseudoclavibacter albus TaxID=272241 RepID=UPI000824AF4C|nr:XRE family transcriptional regulator [Pseudoclavibacter alba]
MDSLPSIAATLDEIPGRLRRRRERKDMSLAELSRLTGISSSTLSRLESGQRKASLELLLPIAAALSISLDELIAPPRVTDPRIIVKPQLVAGRTFVRLSREPHDPQAYKLTIPSSAETPILRSHEGYEWLYVLSGQLRILLGEQDLVLSAGEAAEFDTQIPHWFGAHGKRAVELITMFSKHGERVHLRASQTGR